MTEDPCINRPDLRDRFNIWIREDQRGRRSPRTPTSCKKVVEKVCHLPGSISTSFSSAWALFLEWDM